MKRREQLLRKRRKLVVGLTIGVTTAVVFALTLILIFSKTPSTAYHGVYADTLRSLIEEYSSDPRWSSFETYKSVLHEIYYEYYRKVYNTSVIANTTFTITNQTSYVIRVFLGTNETVYVKASGNDTFYCIVSLSDKPEKIREYTIVSFRVDPPGIDKVINIEIPMYAESFFIFYTNSSSPVHGRIFINKTPPGDLNTVLRIFPVEYTVWLFESWVKDRYVIKPVNLGSLDKTRPPWEIIGEDVREVTSLEACLLMSRLYNLTGIRNHVVAVDLDGDGELDHFALMIEYGKSPSMFGDALLNYILRDANLETGYEEIRFKHVVFNNEQWIILDPLYESKYIPSYIPGREVYDMLGIIY